MCSERTLHHTMHPLPFCAPAQLQGVISTTGRTRRPSRVQKQRGTGTWWACAALRATSCACGRTAWTRAGCCSSRYCACWGQGSALALLSGSTMADRKRRHRSTCSLSEPMLGASRHTLKILVHVKLACHTHTPPVCAGRPPVNCWHASMISTEHGTKPPGRSGSNTSVDHGLRTRLCAAAPTSCQACMGVCLVCRAPGHSHGATPDDQNRTQSRIVLVGQALGDHGTDPVSGGPARQSPSQRLMQQHTRIIMLTLEVGCLLDCGPEAAWWGAAVGGGDQVLGPAGAEAVGQSQASVGCMLQEVDCTMQSACSLQRVTATIARSLQQWSLSLSAGYLPGP